MFIDLKTGVKLHYLRSGPTGDASIVFVNGLTMELRSWAQVNARLNQTYPTLCYDGRGQGQSDKPPGPYTPFQHAEDLKALIEALELKQVHLVGLSNGGLVSMIAAGQLATQQPGKVLSVTTIDSLIRVDPLLRMILESWKAALEAGGPGLRFDVATPWIWGQDFVARHKQDILAFRELAEAADPAAVAALIEGALSLDNAHASLQMYDGPLLALVGVDDVLTPPRYSEEIVAHAQNGKLIRLEHTGHAAPLERPDKVAQHISDFLQSTRTAQL